MRKRLSKPITHTNVCITNLYMNAYMRASTHFHLNRKRALHEFGRNRSSQPRKQTVRGHVPRRQGSQYHAYAHMCFCTYTCTYAMNVKALISNAHVQVTYGDAAQPNTSRTSQVLHMPHTCIHIQAFYIYIYIYIYEYIHTCSQSGT
jgi:hypothetical protein